MEQRVKKKYVEKQAPDKKKYIQKDQKTNYVQKKQEHKPKAIKKEYYQKPKLVERFSSHTQDFGCVICSQAVRKKDSIWTCSCCYLSMHLKCIKTWILNVNKQKNKNQILYIWSCPQCKFEYNQPIPKYYCFCGKFLNPQYERDIEAHSCGQICNRKRGPYCPHPCPQLCHKGRCKPCEFQGISVTCECGKSSRTVKCSQQRQIFQCGKKCQKILNCLKHKCQKNCHHGACLPCKKKHLAKCYCGKNEDVIDCVQTCYPCDQICGKKLNCEFHTCQQKCHEGACKQCQRTPELQKTCPCGAYTIEMLTGDSEFRQQCEDPIPTCGMPCKKPLDCGHQCSRSCHEGNCSMCKLIVQQCCSCGLTSRKIQCYKAHSHKQVLKCDNLCKRKRNCGQHNCNTACCPFRTSPIADDHPCQLTCQRNLNCGKHTCGQNCHMGLCKKCPVIYSQAQFCPCSKTSMRPPIICGTIVPQCDNICSKVMDCGHKCQKSCHYGQCQCYEETFVRCRCEKEEIKTVCGRETLCLNKCKEKLPCGHPCGIQCHKESCEQAHKHHPCRKLCQKLRSDCNHTCSQHCHPTKKCEQFPCQAEIFIKCECGHRQTLILCGMTEDKKHKKQIKCNKKCQNLKRFDVLYKGKETYYPNNMIHFGLKNLVYLQNIQAKLSKFILQSQEPIAQIQYRFAQKQSKLILLNLFQNHYHLNAHFYHHKKYASFTLLQTQHTMIPQPILSSYILKISKGQIKRTNLPFEFSVMFQSEQKQKDDIILRSLRGYLHKYYLERKEKMVVIHFWLKEDGVKAFLTLQSENPHTQLKAQIHQNQDQVEIVNQHDIIQTQIEENTQQLMVIKSVDLKKLQSASKVQVKEQKIQVKEQQWKELAQLQAQSQPVIILPTILPPPQQQKSKPIAGPKIIIKKSTLTFQQKQYPDSKQNVQDIYILDEDQLYGEKLDWNKVVEELTSKYMGPEATQWRIRAVLMVSTFYHLKQAVFKNLFQKIISMYTKDKQKAKRILDIQKLELKSVKTQMEKDGIYLSDHQPQILAYLMLFNYLSTDKIQVQLQDYHLKTLELSQASQILHSVQQNKFEQFYSNFKNSHYILACSLMPFVHIMRQNSLDLLQKNQKLPANNLWKYLLFQNEQELIEYWKLNGLQVQVKFSKTIKEDAYYRKLGQVNKDKIKNIKFVDNYLKDKRDRRCFLIEPEQLVNNKYMTRSFFAFADFKQSINNKYIINLIKNLKN